MLLYNTKNILNPQPEKHEKNRKGIKKERKKVCKNITS